MAKVNTRSAFATLGASNHVKDARQEDDFYATDPITIDVLMEVETFDGPIWEPACGMGHMSERLKKHGKTVVSSDLVERGYSCLSGEGMNFLNSACKWEGDIITNPPFKHAVEFIRHAIGIIQPGKKVAMFLKILFLETDIRKELFKEFPPKTIYIFANRVCCAKDGDFVNNTTKAVGYAWYVWEKGFTGETTLKWVY